jgi:DnaJ-class molecular chaperone
MRKAESVRRALTGTRNQTRIAQSVGTCTMATQSCPDCDTPGEGDCRRCHGEGKTFPDKSFGKFAAEIPCPRCKGTGACPTCGGTGVIEVGGESG